MVDAAVREDNFAIRSYLFVGDDEVTLSGFDDRFAGYLGSDTISAGNGNDYIFGGRGLVDADDRGDVIYGNGGADTIYGNAGNDILYGGNGEIDASDDADLMYGGKGQDEIHGNGGNDSLFGGGNVYNPNDDADVIYGDEGNDYILGNGGDDSIVGSSGNDTMHGGQGDDWYYFGNINGDDHILLFSGAGESSGDIIAIFEGTNNINTPSDALNLLSYSSGNAIINWGNDSFLTLNGIVPNSMTENDFVIV